MNVDACMDLSGFDARAEIIGTCFGGMFHYMYTRVGRILLTFQASRSHDVGFRERNTWKGGRDPRDA